MPPSSAAHASTSSSASTPALDVLRTGVDSYQNCLQHSGELVDPVFGEPTQYGTAYHALGNAVLGWVQSSNRSSDRSLPGAAGSSATAPSDSRPDSSNHAFGVPGADYLERARRGLLAAIAHTANPELPAAASGFDDVTAAVSRGNHRDFTWPPILKTYRLLRELGVVSPDEVGSRIGEVDILGSFRSRPPSNWSAVWLSGEWIRIQEGLSPHTVDDIDAWLSVFFEELLDVDAGFYAEPGLPNSYDLFTRYHLADLVREGYDGAWRSQLDRLLSTGLERSLAVQLSDGSLASAHRSAGQTWTLGAQVAYFRHAGAYLGDPRAEEAADRAFASLRRWQRRGGPFSPVENVLPPTYRVGYEKYTADAHYGNLALAFLAVAVLQGFTGEAPVQADRPAARRIEAAPTYRAVLHSGPYSAAVDAAPAPAYDGFGLTDITFGTGRFLHFASSVWHPRSGRFVNLGSDVGNTSGLERTGPIEQLGDVGVRVEGVTPEGSPHALNVSVGDGITITEEAAGIRALLVPYLLDAGTGVRTTISRTDGGIRLEHGGERVLVQVDAPVSKCVVLEHGFENRRGLCGLIRLELDDLTDPLRYRLTLEDPGSAPARE